jgi:glucose-6-phosphate isomerase
MNTTAWNALDAHRLGAQNLRMTDEFAYDSQRAERFSIEAAGVFLDYSKNRITAETMRLLLSLARERGVATQRDAMMAGARVNVSEQRAVLHMALRNPVGSARKYLLDGADVGADVQRVLSHMRDFSTRVRDGRWRGFCGAEITDIVNIGIGGSDLGPLMVSEALREFVHPRLTMHFVSNVDGAALERALSKVSAETTLFIVASKTFTTQETLTNASSARAWFLANGGRDADVAKHFVAVSTNAVAVEKFGIDTANMFEFWDWVGGRYSLWSAIGLSIALAIGMDGFEELLAGAHAMDEHFASAPLEANMPVLLALIGVWNVNFCGATSQCIAPYAEDLHRLPAYLQQLEMESNGKSVDRDGNALESPSCPVIWGEPGTNGQHAFFQLLHQGTSVIPVDFIAAIHGNGELLEHHRLLLANCIAQSEALMIGKSEAQVHAELRAQGLNSAEIHALTPHKVFAGNRPSNTILLDQLTPKSLGALIALYEQKTFVQGVIWGVNSFDQWGVELGKQLAKTIDSELKSGIVSVAHDGSTQALLHRVNQQQRRHLPSFA